MKAKLLFVLPLALSITLAACGDKKGQSEVSESISESMVESSEESIISESIESISESSEESIISESSEESIISESSEEVVYDLETVVAEFNEAIANYGLALEWNDEYQEYVLAVSFGASEKEDEETLGNAAYTLAQFLPTYMELAMEVYGDPNTDGYYDLFGDGSYYYYIEFCSPDYEVTAVVISYLYNGSLVAQISIY